MRCVSTAPATRSSRYQPTKSVSRRQSTNPANRLEAMVGLDSVAHPWFSFQIDQEQ